LDNSSTFNQPSNTTHNQEVNIIEKDSTPQVQNSISHIKEVVHEEARSSDVSVTWQGTSSEARNLDSQEMADTTEPLNFWDENEIAEELEVIDHDYAESSYDWTNDISRPRSYWEGCRQSRYQEVLNNSDNGEICQLIERYERFCSHNLFSVFIFFSFLLQAFKFEQTINSLITEVQSIIDIMGNSLM
jgi:hypothetical protein